MDSVQMNNIQLIRIIPEYYTNMYQYIKNEQFSVYGIGCYS